MLQQSKQIFSDKKAHGKAVMTPRQVKHVRLLIINDLYNGVFKKTEDLKGKIIKYANEYYRQNKNDSKQVKDLPKSTFYDFLKEYKIPTPNQAKKIPKDQVLATDVEISTDHDSQISPTEHAEFEVEKLGSIKNNIHNPQSESTQATSQLQPKNEYDAHNLCYPLETDFILEEETTVVSTFGNTTGQGNVAEKEIGSNLIFGNQGQLSQGFNTNNVKPFNFEVHKFEFRVEKKPGDLIRGAPQIEPCTENILLWPSSDAKYYNNTFGNGGLGELQRLQSLDHIDYEDKLEMKGQLLSKHFDLD